MLLQAQVMLDVSQVVRVAPLNIVREIICEVASSLGNDGTFKVYYFID